MPGGKGELNHIRHINITNRGTTCYAVLAYRVLRAVSTCYIDKNEENTSKLIKKLYNNIIFPNSD
jgi:hypothetical protein